MWSLMQVFEKTSVDWLTWYIIHRSSVEFGETTVEVVEVYSKNGSSVC